MLKPSPTKPPQLTRYECDYHLPHRASNIQETPNGRSITGQRAFRIVFHWR